jgi:putative phosphoribosyl transferase
MQAAGEGRIWRDRRHAGALLGERLASRVQHHQDTTVVGIPPGGIEVAAALAAVLQLPLGCWSVQRLWLPGAARRAIGALAPGNIQLPDDDGLRLLGLDGDQAEALLRRQARRLERDQRRFGDPGPAELRHRHLILVDEAIRSGLAMAAGLQSLRPLYPASITVAAPVGCREALRRLEPLADEVLVLRQVEQLPQLSDWFQVLLPLSSQGVIALLRAA